MPQSLVRQPRRPDLRLRRVVVHAAYSGPNAFAHGRVGSRFDCAKGAVNCRGLVSAERADRLGKHRGVGGPHAPEHCFARRRQNGVSAAPIIERGLSSEEAGLFEPVDELRHAAAAQRETVGELRHSDAPSGCPPDRPEHVVPAEGRQVRSRELGLDSCDELGMRVQEGAPSAQLRFRDSGGHDGIVAKVVCSETIVAANLVSKEITRGHERRD